VAVRLRQVALVAHDLEPVVAALGDALGVADAPFCDPGVAVFGLKNAVMAVGDTFVEVVSPVGPDTAAGRYLERRHGDGGYMAIFQVDDLEAARARIDGLGIRVVWRSDHPDIAGTHLHPKDVPGALVSIDWADPPGSWRWAGPRWTGTEPAHEPGGITALTVQSERPDELAARWAEVLGCPSRRDGAEAVIPLDGGEVRFVTPGDGRGEGISALEIEVPGRSAGQIRVGGVTLAMGPGAT
jgi:hypothetical protein